MKELAAACRTVVEKARTDELQAYRTIQERGFSDGAIFAECQEALLRHGDSMKELAAACRTVDTR